MNPVVNSGKENREEVKSRGNGRDVGGVCKKHLE